MTQIEQRNRVETGSKACSKCGEVKPLEAFQARKGTRDGKRADCRECVSVRQRAYYVANRERITARERTRYVSGRSECAIVGCEVVGHVTAGMCQKHYSRAKRHGSPDVVVVKRRSPGKGADCHNWKGDDIGYYAAHRRNRMARGSASAFSCVACGATARHWAYDHLDPNERSEVRTDGKRVVYSPDPAHYVPMCVGCHNKFDSRKDAA